MRGITLNTAGTILTDAGVTTTLSGVIINGGSAGSLTKAGTGTLTLTRANTTGLRFDGTATVTASTLSVNGTFGNAADDTWATVNVGGASDASSGTLHGSGTIAGKVTVRKGGTFSVGKSPGVLTTG